VVSSSRHIRMLLQLFVNCSQNSIYFFVFPSTDNRHLWKFIQDSLSNTFVVVIIMVCCQSIWKMNIFYYNFFCFIFLQILSHMWEWGERSRMEIYCIIISCCWLYFCCYLIIINPPPDRQNNERNIHGVEEAKGRWMYVCM
jgi:hypothetical protein